MKHIHQAGIVCCSNALPITTREELEQLIKRLSLYNPTRQYHIHVNSLLYHLKNVGVNYKAIGDSYILF